MISSYDPAFDDELKKKKAEKPSTKSNAEDLTQRIARMIESGTGITEVDLERYIGRNDMLRFNYLCRGMEAGKSVCRIYVADQFGGGGSWGTGFLITPSLLITNNHVIPDEAAAQRSFAEFGYEADGNGILQTGKRYKLEPQRAFLTSPAKEMDLSIIAIAPVSDNDNTSIGNYGFLRMNPSLKKVDELEFVTIIQHPGGDEKYIAIRENKVIKIGDTQDKTKDRLIWYESDTAPGSSGAPVFNDQWQVVALHHSGVPETRTTNGKEEIQLLDGTWVPKEEEDRYDGKVKYIANEGIRISKIVEFVKAAKTDNALIKELVDDVTGVKPITASHIKESIVTPQRITAAVEEKKTKQPGNLRPIEYYSGRKGYDEDFLGVKISMPVVTDAAKRFGTITKVQGSSDNILRYTHFSVIHNSTRKIAFVTAVNIDGKKWTNIKRGTDKWFYDPRIPIEVQMGDEMYAGEPSSVGSKGWFDRGHLVRRQDPDWGTLAEATLADDDTFHWANCSPQYWEFNQGKELWQGLENFILYNTDSEDIKGSVFTGPVFNENDEVHRGVQIPKYFFKVVVVKDKTGKLQSSAYLVSQEKWAENIPFEVLPVGQYNHFQTTVKKIEEQTGLKFDADIVKADLNKGNDDIGLRGLADIKNPKR